MFTGAVLTWLLSTAALAVGDDSVPALNVIPITDAPYMVQLADDCLGEWEGVILNENYILSTAIDIQTSFDYCNKGFKDIVVRVGSTTNKNGTGTLVEVAEAFLHQREDVVDQPAWTNNTALLRLKAPLTFSDSIKPIKIARRSLIAPSKVIITSYDLELSTDYTLPFLLRSVQLAVYSTRKCRDYLNSRDQEHLVSSLFCVEAPYGPIKLLSTGAPAVNGRGELLGFNAGMEDGVYFFTNVRNKRMKRWIEDVLDGKTDGVTILDGGATDSPF